MKADTREKYSWSVPKNTDVNNHSRREQIQMKLLKHLSISKLFILIAALTLCLAAHADCSKAKVKKMSKDGSTVSAIAKKCDMDKDDVVEILQPEEKEGLV